MTACGWRCRVASAQIGLLYLRYVCDPRQLWDWYKDYMHDDEASDVAAGRTWLPPSPALHPPMLTWLLLRLQEFEPSPKGLGRAVTIGAFARDIMLDQVGTTLYSVLLVHPLTERRRR